MSDHKKNYYSLVEEQEEQEYSIFGRTIKLMCDSRCMGLNFANEEFAKDWCFMLNHARRLRLLKEHNNTMDK